MTKIPMVREPAELNVFGKTGIVHGYSTWTETRMSGGGGGGGGYISNGSGYVSTAPVSISSTVTTYQRFFVDRGDGDEFEVKLCNVDFGVRDGHRVTCVYAGHKSVDRGWLTDVYNHNTRERDTFKSAKEKLRGVSRAKIWFVLLVAAFVALNFFAGLIGIAAFGGSSLSVLPLVASVALFAWWWSSRAKADSRRAAIDQELARLAQQHIDEAKAAPRIVEVEPQPTIAITPGVRPIAAARA